MPKRTAISSILLIGVGVGFMLSACGNNSSPLNQPETAQQCAERFAPYANDPAMVQGFAGRPLSVTYSYDVTRLPAADLKALMRLDEAPEKAPKGTMVSGASQEALKKFMAEKVEPRGAIFMSDVSVYRTVQPASSVDQVVPKGCARQQPGMRLIQIDTALAEIMDL